MAYKQHYDKVTTHEMQKKKKREEYENEVIERRLATLAEAQERQRLMKSDLTKIHQQAITRQMEKNQHDKVAEQSGKVIER